MSAPVAIRTATLSDREALIRLNRMVQDDHFGMDPQTYRGDTTETEYRTFWSDQVDAASALVLVASAPDDTVIALIHAEFQEREPTALTNGIKALMVHSIVVDPSWRRRGVATALMAAAEAECLARGIEQIRLTVLSGNSSAQAFYDARGYVRGMVSRHRRFPPR